MYHCSLLLENVVIFEFILALCIQVIPIHAFNYVHSLPYIHLLSAFSIYIKTTVVQIFIILNWDVTVCFLLYNSSGLKQLSKAPIILIIFHNIFRHVI